MPAKMCSKCGSEMTLRKGKFGQFWGCTSYPKCKNMEKATSESKSRTTIETVVKEVVEATPPKFPPSDEQQAILDLFANIADESDAEVIAGAGTGKTTLLAHLTWMIYNRKESAKRFEAPISIAAFAFNKAISEELKTRLAPNTDSRSTHSYGMQCVNAIHTAFGNKTRSRVDNNKVQNILNEYLPLPRYYADMTPRDRLERNEVKSKRIVVDIFVSMCKSQALQANEVNRRVLEDIIKLHGLDIPDWISMNEIESIVKSVLKDCLNTATMDFDDMLWIPAVFMRMILSGLKLQVVFPTYDIVLGDEAQDWNVCQHYLMLAAAGYGNVNSTTRGRIVYVGDPLQAIYGFRGADFKSMGNFKEMLTKFGRKVVSLPLMLTRRCPKEVVRIANQVAPALKALDDAKDGFVQVITDLPWSEIRETPKDWMISCRTNAPLISLAYEFIEKRIPVHIQGRDFGESLLGMIESSGSDNCQQLIDYASTKIGREEAKETPNTALLDKLECIMKLASVSDNIDQIIETIKNLFNDSDNGVLLTSIHKCKGLERRFVICYPPHPPHMMALKTGSKLAIEQEDNLWYVQVTRAMEGLYVIMDQKIPYKFGL